MKRLTFPAFILLFLIGGWMSASFVTGEYHNSSEEIVGDGSPDEGIPEGEIFEEIDSGHGFEDSIKLELNNKLEGTLGEGELTDNFYIALGVGGIGLLIILYFIYSFFKKSKNKWK